ncbi:MAG: helix-turn-helix transcriptional regulator [Pseudomonadota bacterium]
MDQRAIDIVTPSLPEAPAAGLADLAANAILAAGRASFPPMLMDVVGRAIRTDHCSVFAFAGERAWEVFSSGDLPRSESASLARDYVGDYYRADPNRSVIEASQRKGISIAAPVFFHTDPRRIADGVYRKRFFSAADLIDKISIVFTLEAATLYCNFYRLGRSGRFTAEDRAHAHAIAPLVCALIANHQRLSGEEETLRGLSVIGESADLSARERQVCEKILAGLTTEEIALDLGVAASTIVTYRRRAYQKLGLGSKTELFQAAAGGRTGAAAG